VKKAPFNKLYRLSDSMSETEAFDALSMLRVDTRAGKGDTSKA